jgi:hypothetical protein
LRGCTTSVATLAVWLKHTVNKVSSLRDLASFAVKTLSRLPHFVIFHFFVVLKIIYNFAALFAGEKYRQR